jgi:hypothetical protein
VSDPPTWNPARVKIGGNAGELFLMLAARKHPPRGGEFGLKEGGPGGRRTGFLIRLWSIRFRTGRDNAVRQCPEKHRTRVHSGDAAAVRGLDDPIHDGRMRSRRGCRLALTAARPELKANCGLAGRHVLVRMSDLRVVACRLDSRQQRSRPQAG